VSMQDSHSEQKAEGKQASAQQPRSILGGLGLRDFYYLNISGQLRLPMEHRQPSQDLFEMKFCERILARAPSHLPALEVLGHLYTRLGEYDKGLEVDQRIVRLRPERATAHYNLACSLSLTNQVEGALGELALAVRLGYSDLEHLEKDSDLSAVRSDPRYRDFIAMARSAVQHR